MNTYTVIFKIFKRSRKVEIVHGVYKGYTKEQATKRIELTLESCKVCCNWQPKLIAVWPE